MLRDLARMTWLEVRAIDKTEAALVLPLDSLALEFTGATVGWLTRDFQRSGTWGNAAVATAERGRQWVAALLPALVDILTEISQFSFPAMEVGQ